VSFLQNDSSAFAGDQVEPNLNLCEKKKTAHEQELSDRNFAKGAIQGGRWVRSISEKGMRPRKGAERQKSDAGSFPTLTAIPPPAETVSPQPAKTEDRDFSTSARCRAVERTIRFDAL